MSYIALFSLFGLIFGLVGVAANPSPFFAAFGLVVVAVFGCGVLAQEGGVFLSLILFLIYLGGMLVVFAYSVALAADPHPESLGSPFVAGYVVVYVTTVVSLSGLFWEGWGQCVWGVADGSVDFLVFRGDGGGVALVYSSGGGMLIVSGWVLLLTLFVVLELTRGLSRGAMRVV